MKGDNNMSDSNRKYYFDYLRILATIAIITIHVVVIDWCSLDINSFNWGVINFFSGASRWAVPIFFMISGALFLNPEKPISLKKLYTKSILRIATAFVFWSLFYAIIFFDSFTSMLTNIITGHYHMWFCISIIALYIMVPVIRHITASPTVTKYFLIVAFICSFVIPDILRELQQAVYSDIFLGLGNALGSSYNNAAVVTFPDILTYFVLGYYISKKNLTKKARIIIYLLGLYGFFATVFYTHLFSVYQQAARYTYFEADTTHILFAAVGIFVFGKYELSKMKISPRMQKAVQHISKYCFGIYLSHPFTIEILNRLNFTSTSFNPILATPIMVTLTFILSLAISAILNNIPFIKKYIV